MNKYFLLSIVFFFQATFLFSNDFFDSTFKTNKWYCYLVNEKTTLNKSQYEMHYLLFLKYNKSLFTSSFVFYISNTKIDNVVNVPNDFLSYYSIISSYTQKEPISVQIDQYNRIKNPNLKKIMEKIKKIPGFQNNQSTLIENTIRNYITMFNFSFFMNNFLGKNINIGDNTSFKRDKTLHETQITDTENEILVTSRITQDTSNLKLEIITYYQKTNHQLIESQLKAISNNQYNLDIDAKLNAETK